MSDTGSGQLTVSEKLEVLNVAKDLAILSGGIVQVQDLYKDLRDLVQDIEPKNYKEDTAVRPEVWGWGNLSEEGNSTFITERRSAGPEIHAKSFEEAQKIADSKELGVFVIGKSGH